MERKQKIILGIFIIVIFILFIIFVLIMKKNKPKDVVVSDITPVVTETNIISKPTTQVQNERNDIINTARGFIETYGSFSNTSDFSNIKELYPFMTDSLRLKMQAVIDINAGKVQDYFVRVTKVANVGNLKYIDGELNATLNLSVVETSTDSSGANSIKNKIVVIELKRDSEKWRVDEIK